MSTDYFDRVRSETGMRFWVNNPTLEEVDLALDHGAMGCTTNPAFAGSLLRRAPDEILPIVRDCLAASPDDAVVARLVQMRLIARIAERFASQHHETRGREGYVSLQGSPEEDEDPAAIVDEAREARRIGPNVAPKVPATAAGLDALEAIVADGSPVIVTEVFSVAQLVETCERWLAATNQLRDRPPFFLSPITGIFGDHLRAVAEQRGITVPPTAVELAGVVVARRCAEIVRQREYPVVLLFGGARRQTDFTALVGDGLAATINWVTAAELEAADPPVGATIGDAVDPEVTRTLLDAFPEMRVALDPSGLAVEGFKDFGPVGYFRNLFLDGWTALLATIREYRSEGAGAADKPPAETQA
jgi:transaldolase